MRNWSNEARAGRRQQHHRFLRAEGFGVARPRITARGRWCRTSHKGHRPCSGLRRILLAASPTRIGPSLMRGKNGCQRRDAAGLGAAAGDPEYVGERSQRLRGRVRDWCALESLTNSTAPLRPTCSMRCAEPGSFFSPRSISAGLRRQQRSRPPRAARSAHCGDRAASKCRRDRASFSTLPAADQHWKRSSMRSREIAPGSIARWRISRRQPHSSLRFSRRRDGRRSSCRRHFDQRHVRTSPTNRSFTAA